LIAAIPGGQGKHIIAIAVGILLASPFLAQVYRYEDYGKLTGNGAGASAAAIPEPATFLLLIAGTPATSLLSTRADVAQTHSCATRSENRAFLESRGCAGNH
jgi:hypothetical protein